MDNSYIIRTQDNKLICFYYQPELGILSRVYENSRWSKPRTILENTRSNFTVTYDKKGVTYVFCQDILGNIVLCTNTNAAQISNQNHKWSNRVLLKNQSIKVHTIQIHPIITDKGISIVYNAPGEDRGYQLIFQKINENGQWSQAVPIDKFSPMNDCIYAMQGVSIDHFLLFYQTRTPENNLGYREISSTSQGKYNVFQTTTYQVIDTAFLTTNTTIHVLYVIKSMFSCQLIYRKKESDQFSNPIVIWEGQKIANSLLFFAGGKLYITYTVNGQLHYCVSSDGDNFSRPTRYKNKFCLSPVKAIYYDANQDEGSFYCRQVYVDSSGVWDVQLLPDLCDNFYPVNVAPPQGQLDVPSTGEPVEACVLDVEAMENRMKLSNRLSLMENQNNEKDMQLVRLSNLLKERTEDVSLAESEKKSIVKKTQQEKAELLDKNQQEKAELLDKIALLEKEIASLGEKHNE